MNIMRNPSLPSRFSTPPVILLIVVTICTLAMSPDKKTTSNSWHFSRKVTSLLPILAPLPVSAHRFVVIAHRGDHVKAPENSLEALDSAIRHRVDYVEADLRTSADGVLYLMHDNTIDRTTTGKGKLSSLPSAVLDTCHLLNSHETIPRFDRFLEHASGRMNIYLDFKSADVGITMEALRKHRCDRSILVYLNSWEQFREWRKLFPDEPVIASMPEKTTNPEQLEAFVRKHPVEVLDGGHDEYTPEMVAEAKALGLRVWPDIQGTYEQAEWAGAIAKGFTGLQTDHPALLIAWLEAKGLR
jgi:glycerophosphoryl diester phosphodiesterase